MRYRTTANEDRDFAKLLVDNMDINAGFALTWVGENFSPEDVFDYDQLLAWAEQEGMYTEEEWNELH